MAPRKLSDADKRDVIAIYRQPGETTSTIAERYGVSTSTISRILKTQLPEDEYRTLIAQKRASPADKPIAPVVEPSAEASPSSKVEKPVRRRARKRSRSVVDAVDAGSPDDGQLELLASDASEDSVGQEVDDVSAVATELFAEPADRLRKTDLDDDDLDILDEDLDDDELDSELDDDFDDDDFDDDDDADESDSGLVGAAVQIMPIADAVFPRTCYLVVDRLSELITHPLKEFADLGSIPAEQASAQTLPIFDNHRVARRFSRRNQRIIKVPDGQIITKTSYYLQAKGITHLLIDGNIYSLLG
ncbi:MAG: helix-turn-helix domain-containing protein [Cyanobacteria bacterium P01_D01_bin.56]